MPESKALRVLIGLGVIVLGLMFWPQTPISEQTREAMRQIVTVEADALPDLIKKPTDKPTLLFVYASWCPYCRQTWEKTLDGMFTDKALANVRPVFISLDKTPEDFGRYLARTGYQKQITPYLYQPGFPDRLLPSMNALGTRFNGGIPYFALVNNNGSVIGEKYGYQTKEQLSEWLGQAL